MGLKNAQFDLEMTYISLRIVEKGKAIMQLGRTPVNPSETRMNVGLDGWIPRLET